ncbi:MAG TPA: SDR family NAD(P)-dependent oxidoreductase [Caulobacteraceae bacterium]|nr:SDR family NAD(P)-dependent oxidoreductase [Caulobacteraceae bacterium]
MADRITSPFGAFTPAREVVAGHDLTDKTAIVTGAASGLGAETARVLAEAGCAVTLAVRDQEAGERVAALTSVAHRRANIHGDDPHYRTRAYDKWDAYGQSKTANSLFALGFHQRFKDRGVTANAVMPGGIMTPLQRHLPREEMIALGWIDEAGNLAQGFKTTEQGASTGVWAGVGAELEGVGGLYLENCAVARPADSSSPRTGVWPWALDPEGADRLWAMTRGTIGLG